MKSKIFTRKKKYLDGNKCFLLKKKTDKNYYHKFIPKNAICAFCGSKNKNFYITKTIPDFDINILSKKIAKKFYLRSIGKCRNCDFIQEYNKLSKKELTEYFNQIKSKDQTIGEEVWKSYPVPKNYQKFLYNRHFKKRFNVWEKKLKLKIAPKKILILRPTLGFLLSFFMKKFKNSIIEYLDISKISEQTIKNKFGKKIKKINGNIHMYFNGNFLKKKSYDLIVTNHLLVHCGNISETLSQLKSMISLKGGILFTDEINVKYHNPFHINFWDEKMFTKILKKNFNEMIIIRNAGFRTYSTIPFTLKRDNPDFLVFK